MAIPVNTYLNVSQQFLKKHKLGPKKQDNISGTEAQKCNSQGNRTYTNELTLMNLH